MKKSAEKYFIETLSSGESFFSSKPDRYITAVAHYNGKKVKTERMIAIDSGHERIENIIKVTML